MAQATTTPQLVSRLLGLTAKPMALLDPVTILSDYPLKTSNMIDFALLLDDYDQRLSNAFEESDKYNTTRRLLFSLAQRHNNIYAELECLKESTGRNKPFPFLRLPREIRDDINIRLRSARRIPSRSDILVPLLPHRPKPLEAPNAGPAPCE
jgi:hypothetical protein